MSGTERLLDVLTIVATAREPVTARRVGELADLPLSTAYRHLSLLRDRGFIDDLGRETGYGPGPVVLRMAWNVDRLSCIRDLALPEMQKLAEETQESIALMRAVGTEILCVEMLESPHSLRCSFVAGRAQPLIHGASAKAQLAHLAAPLQKKIIEQALGDDRDAKNALENQITTIRENGYAVSESEVDEGVWGVSAPIFSSGSRLEGGISLMAPLHRAAASRDHFIARTCDAARTISQLLNDFDNFHKT